HGTSLASCAGLTSTDTITMDASTLPPSAHGTGLPTDPPARVDGLVAALLALVIAAALGRGVCVYARHLADTRLSLISTRDVPFKYQALTFQRAALASGWVLPIYGSSELFCCGDPFRPTQLFSADGTDFRTFAVGHAGAADLFFMETFAALGRHLKGRKVVLSDSPSWFAQRRGVTPRAYGHSFLPEVAYPFVSDSPISRKRREAGARRMLAYPDTLSEEPLLRLALEDLARPSTAGRLEYAALAPLGRLATRLLAVRDA